MYIHACVSDDVTLEHIELSCRTSSQQNPSVKSHPAFATRRAHLRSFGSVFANQFDVILVADGIGHPVHSSVIKIWAPALAEFATTACKAHASDSAGTPNIVALEDTTSLPAFQILLKLMYSFPTHEELQQLLDESHQLFRDVIRLADGYSMRRLLEHIDDFLAEQAMRSPRSIFMWPREAILWGHLAARHGLCKLQLQCEQHIIHKLPRDDMDALAQVLPIDSALRIVQGYLAQSSQTPAIMHSQAIISALLIGPLAKDNHT